MLLAASQAGGRLAAVGERGLIILSDDQGVTWRQARAVPTSVSLAAVRFADEHTGWAVGHAGVILRTSDGGETWSRQADGRSLAQASLAEASRSQDARRIKAAQWLVDDGPDKPLMGILAFDTQHVLVVGAYGLIFESTDGGATWTSIMGRLDNPKGLHLNAVERDGDAIYIAGEQGLLLRSDDRGKNFHRLQSPYEGSWFALAVTSNGTVIAAGLRGHAFSSSNKGATWSRLEGAAPASFVGATVVGSDRVVLVNQAGQLVSVGNDERLHVLHAAPLPPTSALVSLPKGALLAVGMTGAKRFSAPANLSGVTP
ncbi:WD40/YVTN/BNR-like repeat-containing protein [Denitromonas iodatirespirans]|uniref:Photosynthesis system II assembly factor Ycf48/Hcf136-like domain-containing protein n=1 Tax=Denitromonas iodatirespirans TaxID=2795389 RepID=A0A944HBA0_DENI1|nr:YCF48-related protein [Denitromonas iodatirespirans]MBT0960101.1 hypothetical protein [Denitromonas iodatirespirans]